MTKEFDTKWNQLGLTDDDLLNLQKRLGEYPEAGSIIVGTGGVRKIRVQAHGKGKSGGARVCYIDYVTKEKIYLLTAYGKDEKDNLSLEERAAIKEVVKLLKNN